MFEKFTLSVEEKKTARVRYIHEMIGRIKELGYTQSWIAEKLDVNKSEVSRLYHMTCRLSDKRVADLEEVLKLAESRPKRVNGRAVITPDGPQLTNAGLLPMIDTRYVDVSDVFGDMYEEHTGHSPEERAIHNIKNGMYEKRWDSASNSYKIIPYPVTGDPPEERPLEEIQRRVLVRWNNLNPKEREYIVERSRDILSLLKLGYTERRWALVLKFILEMSGRSF